jgi:sulfite reductase (NADPH) hemoprotein beta-component
VIGPSFSLAEVGPAIERLIECYLAHRDSQAERFIETVRRIGIEPFKEHVYGAPRAQQRDHERLLAVA